jgi:shikimate kinase
MIQRMSDQGRIKFSEKEEIKSTVENKKTAKNSTKVDRPIEEVMEEQKSRKIENEKVINSIRSANSILSAGGGTIKEDGGPRKYIGAETQNSIWDTDVLKKLSTQKTNKEKTIEEKEHNQRVRNGIRQEELDKMVDALQETDTRKVCSVKEIEGSFSNNYNVPKNSLSIFDTKVFDNMPEKTAGEEMAEKVRKEKEKTYENKIGTTKPSDYVNQLFETLTKKND